MGLSRFWEAIVVGGGPAGAAAAIQLAKSGREVCVLERKRGPHDKVCGEFISWEAAHYLAKLGLDLPALDAKPITQLRLISGSTCIESPLPFTAWSLSRRRLDTALLQRVEQVGGTVKWGVTIKKASSVADGWKLESSGCQQLPFHVRTIFLATGKHDLSNWRRPRPREDMIGFKLHVLLHPQQAGSLHSTVEVYLFTEGYAGLEPIENGRANLCLLIAKTRYHHCGNDWQTLLSWLMGTSPRLAARLPHSTPLWPRPLAISGMPYGYVRKPWAFRPGLFPLGDQVAVIPSFAGDGIAMALHSALLASTIYLAGGTSGGYCQQIYRELSIPVRNAQWLTKLLKYSSTRSLALTAAKLWPFLIPAVTNAVRLRGVMSDEKW
jgi:menaquinone-9 beta-reductase